MNLYTKFVERDKYKKGQIYCASATSYGNDDRRGDYTSSINLA